MKIKYEIIHNGDILSLISYFHYLSTAELFRFVLFRIDRRWILASDDCATQLEENRKKFLNEIRQQKRPSNRQKNQNLKEKL